MELIKEYYSIIPFIGLLVETIAQILSYRVYEQKIAYRSFVIGFFTGLLCIAALNIYIGMDGLWGRLFLHGLTFLVLSYGFFHFINLGETARRIRILREFHDSSEGILTYSELLSQYNAKGMVDIRFQRLLDNGQVNEKDGKYYLKREQVLLMANIIIFLKVLLLKRNSEDLSTLNL